MRHVYTPVCSLAQRHSYFKQLATASVRLAPTPDTAAKLRRAGLLLKPTDAGGLVLLQARPVPDAASGPQQPAGEAEDEQPLPGFLFPLRFVVQPISPYFWNFTELPAPGPPTGGPQIYYFRVADAAPADGLTLTMADARLLPLRTLQLDVPMRLPAAFVPGGKLPDEEIRDLVRNKPLPASMLRRNATGLSIDLRPWGPGHYRLQCNGRELLACYADDQLHAAQAWAVLDIDQPALAAGLHVTLAFAARRTRWRYLIRYRPTTDASQPRPEQATIAVKVARNGKWYPAGTQDAVDFAAPKQLPAGAPANLVLESGRALPLAERPAYACTLHYTLHGTPVEVALPAAQGEVLCQPDPDPQLPAFSDILVLL
jgi:hypothetical protein